ncbi:MAG: hypothetical protein RL071_963 [Pseudomonadota bacterium]
MVRTRAPQAAALIAGVLAAPAAWAGRPPMDPLNRLHAGLSVADGTENVGFQVGFDSRLTRVVHVDAGMFLSVDEAVQDKVDPLVDDPKDFYSLRHGVFVAPGARIPHRYGDGFNWDLIGRGGFAVIWAADSSQQDQNDQMVTVSEPALLLGADLLLRYDRVGLNLSGKAFGFHTYAPAARVETGAVRPQVAAELVFQF